MKVGMNWTRVAAFVCTPVIVTFLSLEIGVRAIHAWLLSANSDQYSQYSNIYSDERDQDYLFWHHPNVNWKLTGVYDDFTFITNRYGHRALTDEINFDQSIVFLGDSIIEGSSVENDETLSHLVQQQMQIPTVNLGVGSSNTVQQYYLAQEKILESFGTKLLVLGFCINDIEQNSYRRYFDTKTSNWKYHDTVIVNDDLTSHTLSKVSAEDDGDFSLKEFLKQSQAVLFVTRLIKKALGIDYSAAFNASRRTYTKTGWKNTEYFLIKMSDLASQIGSDFLVVIFPYQDQIEENHDNYEQIMLKNILQENNIRFFDPSETLIKNRAGSSDASNLYHDNTHPNTLGTSIIASALVDYLQENRLIIGN